MSQWVVHEHWARPWAGAVKVAACSLHSVCWLWNKLAKYQYSVFSILADHGTTSRMLDTAISAAPEIEALGPKCFGNLQRGPGCRADSYEALSHYIEVFHSLWLIPRMKSCIWMTLIDNPMTQIDSVWQPTEALHGWQGTKTCHTSWPFTGPSFIS